MWAQKYFVLLCWKMQHYLKVKKSQTNSVCLETAMPLMPWFQVPDSNSAVLSSSSSDPGSLGV